MTRKLIALLLVAAAIITILPTSALAADVDSAELIEEAPEAHGEDGAAAETTAASKSGTFGANGNNLKWALNSSGTLTITGTGAMPEDMLDSPWFSETNGINLKGSIKKVVIAEGVTTIGDFAFMCFQNLTSVTIPDSVTRIGTSAFRQCPLTSVTIGTGAKEFGFKPFYTDPWAEAQAEAQGDLLIINHVLADVDQNGPELQTISVPSGVTGISEEAFAECISLENLIFPDTLTSLSKNAIINGEYFELTTLTIPASVTSIGEHAFGFTREYVEEKSEYQYTVDPDFTAKVYAGSAAESWCRKNGVAYTVIDSNGWQQSGSSWYYYQNGKAATGWLQDGSKWYYMDPATGAMLTGWQKVDGKWYYLKNNMLTGWQKIDGKWYYLKNNMKTGWQKIDGKWYYLKNYMKTGWQKIDGKWYYLKNYMKTGWQKAGGSWYYLNTEMKTGWQKVNGIWYYLKSNGAMACSETLTINNTAYTFDANGHYSISHTHTWTAATCTSPKTCSTCGATEGDALGHDYVTRTVTHTVEGSDEESDDPIVDFYCTDCGAYEGTEIRDIMYHALLTNHNHYGYMVRPGSGTQEETITYYVCSRCGVPQNEITEF